MLQSIGSQRVGHHAASVRESDDADETVDSAVKRHVLMVADKYPGISITELARKLGKCPSRRLSR